MLKSKAVSGTNVILNLLKDWIFIFKSRLWIEVSKHSCQMVVMSLPSARRRLGRIRCVQETIASLIEGKPLPASLCYVPLELEYYSPGKSILKLHASHCTSSQIVKELVCTAESRLIVKGEELCNKHGKWLQIKKVGDRCIYGEGEYLFWNSLLWWHPAPRALTYGCSQMIGGGGGRSTLSGV